jgi:LPS-assembly protein
MLPSLRRAAAVLALILLASLVVAGMPPQRVVPAPQRPDIAELSSSGPQQRRGDLFLADGDVEIHYGELRLRADHVEYNTKTYEAAARGHVQLDFENQHLDGDEATVNVRAGTGHFRNVRGYVRIDRRPNPSLLITQNPLYFQARDVERTGPDEYVVRQAWITVCDPEHPTWQFFAPHARVRLNKSVALVNANFRLYRVPLVWLPYASAPAGPRVRQSGFLIPDIGHSNSKGFILGDAFYWAPASWLDATVGAQYLSRRGSAERGEFRARPAQNTSLRYTYYGVIDRGLPGANGVAVPEGGHQQQFEMQSLLPNHWRFVADFNELSSLTFRLAFADTYGEAINSEVRSAVFLTNNFNGFSLNFSGQNDKSFLLVNPQTAVTLRTLPEIRLGSVDRQPWPRVPLYFGFDAFAGAAFRKDPVLQTPAMVQRTELAPRVTLPLRFGSWMNLTATAALRTARYGASLAGGTPQPVLSEQPVTRNDGEFTIDLRPPSLERYFDRPKSKRRYKHTIEPEFRYHYVTGINDFERFIRFDSDAALTNTNEIEYGLTQRLFVKSDGGQPNDVVTWRVVQKHFFDTTFGNSIVNGQRNVFQTLDDITPFAFANTPRNWSPIVSQFKITPGGLYDIEQLLEYDPQREKIITIGTLVKIKPWREFFATVAHYRLQDDPILQPLSNQVRALFGYGRETRRGFNVTAGVSYDITNSSLQNQIVQVSYNGACCGLALEYRRLSLASVRTDNQFRVSFIVANIGTFGNLRHQEKIF